MIKKVLQASFCLFLGLGVMAVSLSLDSHVANAGVPGGACKLSPVGCAPGDCTTAATDCTSAVNCSCVN